MFLNQYVVFARIPKGANHYFSVQTISVKEKGNEGKIYVRLLKNVRTYVARQSWNLEAPFYALVAHNLSTYHHVMALHFGFFLH